MSAAIILQIQSFLILCLMGFGVYSRKKRSLHVKIMSTVITWDILLILQIELGRSAINKAAQAMINPILLNIHVSIAVLTVLFYFGLIATGRKLLKGDESKRSTHKKLGWSALILRILTFLTSFYAVAPKELIP